MTATMGEQRGVDTSPDRTDSRLADEVTASPDGRGFLGSMAAFLLGPDTVRYLERRRTARRRYPYEKLAGESRWEVLDSDRPDPGPYAMLDERAGALMMSEVYREALAGLKQSYVDDPILVDPVAADHQPGTAPSDDRASTKEPGSPA